MQLSEAGEARIRGYLFMLDSSLRSFLRREVATDAVREVESHIRERVRETDPLPNERDALNRLLEALGPPHRLARAYSAELAVDEAVSSGRVWPIAKAVLAVAAQTTEGFFVGIGLFCGYLIAIAALLVFIARPFFPNHVGVVWVNGRFHGAGLEFGLPPGAVLSHGWELAIGCGVLGVVMLVATHLGAKAWLRRVRRRREERRAFTGA
jgi:uncharacterized membrane protein